MMTSELLELALLDAFGLLEGSECDAFEQALADASDGVRDQVRLEQERILNSDLANLGSDEPSDALRARVIEAVRDAMHAERAAESEVSASSVQDRRASGVIAHIADAAMPEAAEDAAPVHRHRSRGIRPVAVWRAAAVAFAAASVVFGWSTFQLRSEYENLSQAQEDDALFEALAAEVGRQFVVDALVDPDTERHFLRQVADTGRAVKAEAAVWTNPGWNTARFFAVPHPLADSPREITVWMPALSSRFAHASSIEDEVSVDPSSNTESSIGPQYVCTRSDPRQSSSHAAALCTGSTTLTEASEVSECAHDAAGARAAARI